MNYFNIRKTILFLPLQFLIVCLGAIPVYGNDIEGKAEVIIIYEADIPRSEKEALLILPGLGDSGKGRKAQQAFFEKQGFDLFIPDFKERKSFEGTVEKFSRFFTEKHLDQYKKVHIFSYILGSWVINEHILRNGKGNISSIVYDRSPLQERAPQVVADKIPFLGKLVSGKVVIELSTIAYPTIPDEDIQIGILVESKATKLIRMFRKTAMSYGPIDWKKLEFHQEYDDLAFTRLNHDEMYIRFDVVGKDILHFIRNGRFTDSAQRSPYEWDVFEKYKE